MSLRIVDAAIKTESSDQLHEGRLLVLLRHAAKRGTGSVEGITKLAKEDFLLRYPLYFERLLNKVNRTRKRPLRVPMQEFETDTVESRMIRFRYGPWDPRYRRWIGLLVAKGLADTYLSGRTVHVKLTEKGLTVAETLADTAEFSDLDSRARLIDKAVGSKSGQWLKEAIYEAVPELTGMTWGDEITP